MVKSNVNWAWDGVQRIKGRRQRNKLDNNTRKFLDNVEGTKLGYILPTRKEYDAMGRDYKNFYNKQVERLQSKNERQKGMAIRNVLYVGADPKAEGTGFSFQKQQKLYNIREVVKDYRDMIVPYNESVNTKGFMTKNRDVERRTAKAFNAIPENSKKYYMDLSNYEVKEYDTLDTSADYLKREVKSLEAYEKVNKDGKTYSIVVDTSAKPISGKGRGAFAYGTYRDIEDVQAEINKAMETASNMDKYSYSKAVDIFSKPSLDQY